MAKRSKCLDKMSIYQKLIIHRKQIWERKNSQVTITWEFFADSAAYHIRTAYKLLFSSLFRAKTINYIFQLGTLMTVKPVFLYRTPHRRVYSTSRRNSSSPKPFSSKILQALLNSKDSVSIRIWSFQPVMAQSS